MFEPLNTPGAKAPTQGVLLAIDVGGTKTQVACYDPSSQHLSTRRLATHAAGLPCRHCSAAAWAPKR